MNERPQKILVVDDDALVREIAVKTLQAAGYAAAEAVNGQDGYDKAIADPPQLIMVDLMMPVMHGFDLCGKLRAEKIFDATRIIVISGKCYAADKKAALQLGADAYLEKPYSGTELLELIGSLLKHPGSSGS